MSFWGNFSFFGGLAKCARCFPTLPSSLSHSCALGLRAVLLSPVPGVALCVPWAQDLSRAPGIQMESSEHLRAFSSAEKMLGALSCCTNLPLLPAFGEQRCSACFPNRG